MNVGSREVPACNQRCERAPLGQGILHQVSTLMVSLDGLLTVDVLPVLVILALVVRYLRAAACALVVGILSL
jgi:hypothetical protein